MTSVAAEANTEMDPLVPAGTMAALAIIAPLTEFNVDTTGIVVPVGQTVR
jgi:hypothetical protein